MSVQGRKIMVRATTVLTGLIVALMGLDLCTAPAALTQTATSVEAIALYQGADREQKLLAGAKSEGAVSLYTSMISADQQVLADAFTKRYGIKLQWWRSSSEGLLQRLVAEARTGRNEADLVDNNVAQVEALRRERLLQRVESPMHARLIPEAIPAHKEWVGNSIDLIIQGYNSNKIRPADLPRSYQDLLNPKWKGQLGVEAGDQHWFATILEELGRDAGMELFKKIVDTNGISVRSGHALLANMVASGEVPLALTVYQYLPSDIKRKGGPIEPFVISSATGSFRSIGMMKAARHPHAALLYFDFLLSDEGQQILLSRSRAPTSKDIDSPWKNMPIKYIDPVRTLDMNDQWIQDFETAITKRAQK
jgi:iron(III) transport system substrate-binding protein